MGVNEEELIVTAGDTVDLMRLLLTSQWWEIVRLLVAGWFLRDLQNTQVRLELASQSHFQTNNRAE